MNYPKHLFIPYLPVFHDTFDDKQYIMEHLKNSFEDNYIGNIQNINFEIIHDIQGENYYECFIEMNEWYTSENSQRILSCICDEKKNYIGLTLYYTFYNIKNIQIKVRAYDPKKNPNGLKTSYENEMYSRYKLINH